MINQDSWMFTVSYEEYRRDLLASEIHIDSLIHLGPHAFAEIGGEKVKSVTFVIGKNRSISKGAYISVYDYKYHYEKEQYSLEAIRNHACGWFYEASQDSFVHIEGEPISFWGTEKIYATYTRNRSLSAVANPCVGLQTADNDRFLRIWFEVDSKRCCLNAENAALAARSQKKWFPYNKGGAKRRWYGNQELIVNWENDGQELRSFKGAVIRNPSYYFKPCISWGLISGPLFRYYPNGFIYDVQGMSCFYESIEQLQKEIVWQNTKVFNEAAKIISPAGHIQIGEIGKMPCCDNAPEGIENVGKDNIVISKFDWDSHETSWDFKTNELYRLALGLTYDQVESSLMTNVGLNLSLEEVVSRYTKFWQEKFMQLHANEEELNRQFIEIYGLQDELTPDVPLDEITILQKGEKSIEEGQIVWHKDVIIKQFISWLAGCFMGRYSVDKPGLIIASQGQKVEDLDLPAQTLEIDDDGIIPIVQEADFFVDDMTQRFEAAVRTLFGEDYFYENMKYIKACLGQELRDYLYKDYYNDHLQMYSVKGAKRPIYWLFSSRMGDKKKKGYFKALVYMHRLEPDTLSKLHADYVHPYLQKIEQQQIEAEDQAARDDLSQAQRNKALKQADEMKEKVREVKAFETQLVEMASHRLSIDLDDGVKANYPKFYPLVEPIRGLEASED